MYERPAEKMREMDRASEMVSSYDYETKTMAKPVPAPSVRQSNVEEGFDYLSANIARLDDAIDRLFDRLEIVTKPVASPDLSGSDKRDSDLSAIAISLFDKGDWVRRIAQRIEYFIERIDL